MNGNPEEAVSVSKTKTRLCDPLMDPEAVP